MQIEVVRARVKQLMSQIAEIQARAIQYRSVVYHSPSDRKAHEADVQQIENIKKELKMFGQSRQ